DLPAPDLDPAHEQRTRVLAREVEARAPASRVEQQAPQARRVAAREVDRGRARVRPGLDLEIAYVLHRRGVLGRRGTAEQQNRLRVQRVLEPRSAGRQPNRGD